MSIEAMKQARSVISSINAGKHHALKKNGETVYWQRDEWVRWALDEVLPLIDQAIAEAEKQEPVGVVDSTISGHIDWLCTFFPKQGTKLYTTSQQRKPLTNEQIEQIENGIWRPEFFDDVERHANREFCRAIEAAHGIKENT